MSLGARKVKSAEAVRRTGVGSKYQPYIDEINSLKPGQALEINVNKGDDPMKARNRLNSAIRSRLKALPKGWRFIFRVTANGKVAVEYGRSNR